MFEQTVMEIARGGELAFAFERARSLAKRSQCQKMHYGAVLVNPEGNVIGEGFNHSIIPWLCCQREGVKSGTRLERCGAIHAEQQAMIDCYRMGNDPYGAIMVVFGIFPGTGNLWTSTFFSCTFCARLMYGAGLHGVALPSEFDGNRLVDWTVLAIDQVVEGAYAYLREK